MLPPTVPTIDLQKLERDIDDNSLGELANVERACREIGFFQLKNHGVPIDLQDAILDAAKGVFDLPQNIKKSLSIEHSTTSRGYSPIEHQQLDPRGFPDYKESFYVTKDTPESGNLYPPEETLPLFRSITSKYYEAMITLGQRVFRLIAASLSLEPSFFDAYTGADGNVLSSRGSTLRLVHYPPMPSTVNPRHIGCGAHTDFGSITFLLQGDVSGLEIQPPNSDEWISVPPQKDIIIVNMGDMLQKWTNDYFVSAVHRVSFFQNTSRYSVLFFFNGNHDFIIQPLQECLGRQSGFQSKYDPFTVGSHIRSRLRETHVESLQVPRY